MTEVDLIVIGGGPGGYETALSAAREGLDTVLVEAKQLGGTCLNEGCIPTKCLCRSADVLDLCKEPNAYGVECSCVKFDIEKAQERKNNIVSSLRDGITTLMISANVRVVYGKAELSGVKTIKIENAHYINGTSAESDYKAKNIIIATGSKTNFLAIPGVELHGVLTSRELLSVEKIPSSLCIIGGGVIGIEFASIFSSFGTKVSVVEYCKEILPNFDSELSKRLRLIMKRKGVDFRLGSAVNCISKAENGNLSVKFSSKNADDEITSEYVLMAVGRKAEYESLNLSEFGIETSKGCIVVDENFQTSIDGIYAVGDVNGICQLAHAAKYQGKRALNHILNKSDNLNFNIVPAAVFTAPEFAMVGKTEDMCRANAIDYTINKAFFRANGKAMALGSTEGLVKIISAPDKTIIGCHILGPHASDLIEEVCIVMQKSGMLIDISQTIHAHPTLGEVVWDSAAG